MTQSERGSIRAKFAQLKVERLILERKVDENKTKLTRLQESCDHEDATCLPRTGATGSVQVAFLVCHDCGFIKER